MNIKSIAQNIPNFEKVSQADTQEKVRFQKATDRDANGKQEHHHQQQQERQFTEEEWLEAIEKLRKLPAVLKNHLRIEWEQVGEQKFVKIFSLENECIRRLNSTEVWSAINTVDTEQPKGQLLNKAM